MYCRLFSVLNKFYEIWNYKIFSNRSGIILKIHGWRAKKKERRWFCLFSFPEKLTFHWYALLSDCVYLQITHHGVVTVNASNSHQHVSWYDSPLCTSEEITRTHQHKHKHTPTHSRGLYTSAGQPYLRGQCVFVFLRIPMCPLTWARMESS